MDARSCGKDAVTDESLITTFSCVGLVGEMLVTEIRATWDGWECASVRPAASS